MQGICTLAIRQRTLGIELCIKLIENRLTEQQTGYKTFIRCVIISTRTGITSIAIASPKACAAA